MQSALLGNIYVITKNNYQRMFWAVKKKVFANYILR